MRFGILTLLAVAFSFSASAQSSGIEHLFPSYGQLVQVDPSILTLPPEVKQNITPFVCIGAESAAVLARATYQCLSTRGHFTFSVTGIEAALLLAANLSFGYARGPITQGLYKMNVKIGAYKGIGGTIMNGGPLRLFGVGLGLGGEINYGVPADSLFGGQLTIE